MNENKSGRPRQTSWANDRIRRRDDRRPKKRGRFGRQKEYPEYPVQSLEKKREDYLPVRNAEDKADKADEKSDFKSDTKKTKKSRHSRWISSEFRLRALLLLLCLLIPFLVMVIVMAAYGVEPFGHKSLMIIDALHQYMPFFSVLYDKLHSGAGIFYSWRAGLGINFLSLMSYYLMSPLNLLIVFFGRSQLNMAMSWIMALKIALSGLSMGIWCNAKSKKPNPFTVAAALAYALNSYMVGYCWNIMWLDAIMVLPLIMLGIDRLVDENDGKLYCISLFYALFCNYYIGYMICIFCVMWFFLQHFEGIGHFLKKSLSFGIYSLLAGGMAAVILLPAFLGIRQTAAGGGIEFPDEKFLTSFPDLLNRQITMNMPVTHDNNFDGNANLYVGIFVLVMFFLYLLNMHIKISDKIRRLIVIAFLYFSFCEIQLNYIWHGFHDQYGIPNRFSFLLGFLLITMAFQVAENLDQVKGWQIPVALFGSLLIIWCGRMFGEEPPENDIYLVAVILTLTYVLIFLFIALCQRVGKQEKERDSLPVPEEGSDVELDEKPTPVSQDPQSQNDKKIRIPPFPRIAFIKNLFRKEGVPIFCLVLTLIVIVEISASAILGFYENGQINVPKFYSYTKDMEEGIRKVDDGTFYRSEVTRALMLDEAIYYPMNTVGLFGSTAPARMVDVMDQLGFATGANEYKYIGENALTDYLLNVRYQYYKEEDSIFTGFQYKENAGRINIFENPWKTSVGYMVRESIEDFFENGSAYPFRSMNLLAENAFGQLDLFENIEISDPMTEGCNVESTGSPGEYRFHYDYSSMDNIVFNIPVEESADNLCVYYDGTQVEEAVVSLNGKDLITGDLNGKMIDCGKVEANSWLSVFMKLKGEEKTGIVRLSAAKLNKEVIDRIEKEQEESGFVTSRFTDCSLEGKATVHSRDNGRNLLFLSIPYDEGWTVKVDGKKVKAQAIGKAFLGLKLEDGTHDISLSYVSPGFRTGLVISAVSLILFLILLLVRHIRKRTGRKHQK